MKTSSTLFVRAFLAIQYLFPQLIAQFLLVQLHLPLYIAIQNHMLKQQLIFSQNTFLEIWKLLLIALLKRIQLVHELQALQIKGCSLFVILQKDFFLIFVKLIMSDVLF